MIMDILSAEEPIFVCGVPKSGTTMVGQILANNPDLQTDSDIVPALDFIRHVEKTYKDFFFFNEQPGTILGDMDKYWTDNDYREWHLLNLEYFKSIHYSYRMGARHWGSSSPLCYQHTSLLWKWFPKAVFLMVMRDPRDQWSSFKHLHMRKGADSWKSFNYCHVTLPSRGNNHPQIKFVEYHEVVHNPTIVFDTLGLSVPENCTKGMRDIFLCRTHGNADMIDELRRGTDMITSRIGRWKRDLNGDEIRRCTEAFPKECEYYDNLDL